MTSSKTTWLTLLALKEPRLAEVQKIQVALAEQGRGELPPELTSQTEGMLTFAWGEATAACTLVPRPIPASQLAGPCETAWYWPQAADGAGARLARDPAQHGYAFRLIPGQGEGEAEIVAQRDVSRVDQQPGAI